MRKLKAFYGRMSTELLQAHFRNLSEDLASKRGDNMLFNRATAEKYAQVIKSILEKRAQRSAISKGE